MGKLDSLKIDNSPLAFASFAAKHNALVDLLAGMVGENGISVVMAERNAIIRGNIANSSAASGSYANVVGTDGRLTNVASGAPIANAYPTSLRTVSSGRTVRMDSTGLAVEGSALDFRHDPVTGLGGWYVGSLKLEIDTSLLTANVTLRELDVCGGQKILILASAPYS